MSWNKQYHLFLKKKVHIFMLYLIIKIEEFSLENYLTPLLITLSINPPPFIKVEKNICKNAETLNQEDWIHCSKDVNMIGKYISS